MTLLAPLLLFLFLLLLQGALLQAACTVCEAPIPGYARALGIALLGALLATMVSAGWSCTFGLVLRALLGATFANMMRFGIVWLVIASVYRSSLDVPFRHASLIAAVHNLMAWAIGGALWALLGWLSVSGW